MTKRILALLIGGWFALTASTCGTRPVVTPTPVKHYLAVHVQTPDGVGIPNATVSVVDKAPNPNAGASTTTNTNGDTIGWLLNTPAGFTVVAHANGYVDAPGIGVTLTTQDAAITIVLQPEAPPSQPVHLDGVHLRTTDNRIYRYRSVTAMDVEASTSDGIKFLDWAKQTGFHDVRVLTTASITAPLPPALGEANIATLCSALRESGMGAELVVNADTSTQGMSDTAIRQHTQNVAQAVAANCADLPIIFELANENAHPSQSTSLQNDSFLLSLKQIVHSVLPTIPVSLGSTCCGQPDTVPPYPGGDYITLHLDRSRTPFWDEVRRVKDLIDLQNQARTMVADDEGMGAGEVEEAGRRSATPTRFFVQGVLDRLGELGSTFHCNDCVSAKIPGPVQQACARAYIAGATIVPDDQIFQFYNDTIGDAATNGGNWSHVEKLFTFENVTGGQSFVVALNVTGDPGITWKNGWHQTGQLDTSAYPGILILKISK